MSDWQGARSGRSCIGILEFYHRDNDNRRPCGAVDINQDGFENHLAGILPPQ